MEEHVYLFTWVRFSGYPVRSMSTKFFEDMALEGKKECSPCPDESKTVETGSTYCHCEPLHMSAITDKLEVFPQMNTAF